MNDKPQPNRLKTEDGGMALVKAKFNGTDEHSRSLKMLREVFYKNKKKKPVH